MSFSVFSLNPLLEQTIRNCGCTAPPSIQQQAISLILEQHDLFGLVQTETGKAASLPVRQSSISRKPLRNRSRFSSLYQPGNWLNRSASSSTQTFATPGCVAVRFAMRRNGRKQHPAFGSGQRVLGTLSLGVNLLTPQAFLDLPYDLTD